MRIEKRAAEFHDASRLVTKFHRSYVSVHRRRKSSSPSLAHCPGSSLDVHPPSTTALAGKDLAAKHHRTHHHTKSLHRIPTRHMTSRVTNKGNLHRRHSSASSTMIDSMASARRINKGPFRARRVINPRGDGTGPVFRRKGEHLESWSVWPVRGEQRAT